MSEETLRREFAAHFGRTAELVARAPGRVNLIGEHTDYNDGLVLPAAIDRFTWVAAAQRDDRLLRVVSHDATGEHTLDLDRPAPAGAWSDYVVGVAAHLERHGVHLCGADLSFATDIPLGAGLSSSAAFEVAAARALLGLAETSLPPLELARLCQAAEHEFAGTQCGLMDQYTSCHGESGGLLLLDCRTQRHRVVALPARATLLICNSMVRHDLAAGEYNLRRADCNAAVRALHAIDPHLASLRDLRTAELPARLGRLEARLRHRVRHVVSENERVTAAATALECNDLEGCGHLLYASHESLRDDYEVSCSELDMLVEAARRIPGIFGARMTGGGFGGCTVNLVDTGAAESAANALRESYLRASGRRAEVYVCRPAAE